MLLCLINVLLKTYKYKKESRLRVYFYELFGEQFEVTPHSLRGELNCGTLKIDFISHSTIFLLLNFNS